MERLRSRHIGERDATIVGFPSPGIVLGTPYENFYVRGRFDSDRDLILKLGVTHLLLRDQQRDGTRIIMQREFPELMEKLKSELEVAIRKEHLVLYDVESALRERGATARH